ncbi:stage II sporulation protein GA (sporulation sigma-E factor processing peptidase) [Alkalithermobacter thermoalcaliphilus JW-YL-7 = DSM 7308]|uniref:Sporulation sigma-E factor-processing peptidase n=1 Tax=Alkalithermobacter thermoalcaliphilus JW-YL-7 = DSM 7308 TaxID=1121328 RepID=A0A150FPL4_CLOPD|nr:peptidase U4 sporulation factor SpoIIGA [[Clostridium] paradoxum JW-YL-7 = DSM 7308]SHK98161.1 stage II sporulation protein GA (sporulation sigma-E factor processing peptidase) [[Clostridium] paradoxum JW-YL-7 = DSM 7308]
MIVYAEYYFLQNLLLDYIIIISVGKILNINMSKKRVYSASFIGALYSMAYFNQNLLFLYNIFFKIIFTLFIVYLSFSYTNLKTYIKSLATFYVVNIFVSGSMFFIIYFTGIGHMTTSLILIVGLASSKFIINYQKILKSIGIMRDTKQDIVIHIEDKSIKCSALLDTGNLLKDPLTNDPVIVVNVKALENILPEDLIYMDYSNMDYKKADHIANKLTLNMLKRFRLIPYKVVGSEKNLLIGFKADSLQINGNERSNIILGISNFNNTEYDAILNPNII